MPCQILLRTRISVEAGVSGIVGGQQHGLKTWGQDRRAKMGLLMTDVWLPSRAAAGFKTRTVELWKHFLPKSSAASDLHSIRIRFLFS